MTDDERVERRAESLLPEERAAGSDDPRAQAEAVLSDSDARERYDESGTGLRIDHRTSEESL